jgi:hypothetical protein
MTRGGKREGAGRPKNGPRFGKWTAISEALPEYYEPVITNTSNQVISYLGENGKWYYHEFDIGLDDVTHWMPMPPPAPGGSHERV